MRLVTWNLNGIRAAIRKGMDDFVERINPDILLLQETRALPEQLPKDWIAPMPHTLLHPAEKKGYSGELQHFQNYRWIFYKQEKEEKKTLMIWKEE